MSWPVRRKFTRVERFAWVELDSVLRIAPDCDRTDNFSTGSERTRKSTVTSNGWQVARCTWPCTCTRASCKSCNVPRVTDGCYFKRSRVYRRSRSLLSRASTHGCSFAFHADARELKRDGIRWASLQFPVLTFRFAISLSIARVQILTGKYWYIFTRGTNWVFIGQTSQLSCKILISHSLGLLCNGFFDTK